MKNAISAATAKYPMAQCSSYLITEQVGILLCVLKKENWVTPLSNV